jgi:hypothetical protein
MTQRIILHLEIIRLYINIGMFRFLLSIYLKKYFCYKIIILPSF